MIPKDQIFFKYLKHVLPLEAFNAFLCSSVFDKALFCLGEMRGMLVNNEHDLWYSRVGEFWCQFGIGERKFVWWSISLCCWSDQHHSRVRTMALSVMVVECEWIIMCKVWFGPSHRLPCANHGLLWFGINGHEWMHEWEHVTDSHVLVSKCRNNTEASQKVKLWNIRM